MADMRRWEVWHVWARGNERVSRHRWALFALLKSWRLVCDCGGSFYVIQVREETP